MVEDFMADAADTSSSLGEKPENIIKMMFLTIAFFIFLVLGMNKLSGYLEQVNYQMFTKGISNGLLSYSQCYSMNNDNLSRLAEGYLNNEDLDTAKYNLDTNKLDVDIKKANCYFYRILHGCTGIKEQDLRDSSQYELYIVNIYSLYDHNTANGVFKESYVVQITDSKNDKKGTTICRSTDAVESFLREKIGIKSDISDSLANSIHRAQKYSRKTSYSNGVHVVSSFNTYMCFGKDIPINGWVLQHPYDFCEMQTYSTER